MEWRKLRPFPWSHHKCKAEKCSRFQCWQYCQPAHNSTCRRQNCKVKSKLVKRSFNIQIKRIHTITIGLKWPVNWTLYLCAISSKVQQIFLILAPFHLCCYCLHQQHLRQSSFGSLAISSPKMIIPTFSFLISRFFVIKRDTYVELDPVKLCYFVD